MNEFRTSMGEQRTRENFFSSISLHTYLSLPPLLLLRWFYFPRIRQKYIMISRMLKRHDNLFYLRVINCLRCHGGSAYLGSPPMFPFLAHPVELVSDLENTYAHFCAMVLLDRYTEEDEGNEKEIGNSGVCFVLICHTNRNSAKKKPFGSREFTVLYIL